MFEFGMSTSLSDTDFLTIRNKSVVACRGGKIVETLAEDEDARVVSTAMGRMQACSAYAVAEVVECKLSLLRG